MIIGISGKSGSGKSTAADFIASFYGMRKTAFASSLKEVAAFLLNVPIELFDTQAGKNTYLHEWKMTARDALIRIGEGLKISLSPYVWIKNTNLSGSVVIEDVRFEEEYFFLKRSGALLIRIDRDNCNKIDSNTESELDNHSFDIIVFNNGTIDELHENLKSVITKYVA